MGSRLVRRVVVTGIGAITPIGSGAQGLWAGVRHGQPGTRRVTRFDPTPFRSQIAAEIDGFDPLDYLDARRARRLDRFAQLAVVASRMAVDDSGLRLDALCRDDVAIHLGSALGGIAFAEEQHARFVADGVRAVEPLLALAVFGGAAASNVAIELNLRGPAVANANSCASGAIAVGEAFRLIKHGGASVALAGGVEAPLAPLTFGAFALIKAMSTRNDSPAQAGRPFDRHRDGFVMGEGAAVLVLEEREHALVRGARSYAEVLGYGSTNDAHHMTAPLPSGEQAARAMRLALVEAGLRGRDLHYLNAHATGTPLGDAAEALAINLALGQDASRVPVSGTKGLYGHPLGASGAIEAAITALVIERGWLPPTANLTSPDPACPLAHVPAGGTSATVDVAMTNAFGFGGANASLVLGHANGA